MLYISERELEILNIADAEDCVPANLKKPARWEASLKYENLPPPMRHFRVQSRHATLHEVLRRPYAIDFGASERFRESL
jgi:hypothetical protein